VFTQGRIMRQNTTSLAAVLAVLALAPAALVACGSSGSPPAAAAAQAATVTPTTANPTGAPAPAQVTPTVVLTRFSRYQSGADAITYDPSRVPVDADVAVVQAVSGGQTLTLLAVRGLPPNQHFGAHLHKNGCGANPQDAGSHYQHQPDPKTPSTDPAYANPHNEIWLDFTTDATGSAHSVSTVGWTLDNRRRAIVIHAEPTNTAPGHAGEAGARLACVDL
jgi:Cu-Zn family superoxide dismutase